MAQKTNYFAGCNTVQEAKKAYFKLANQLHPDKAKEKYSQAAWLDLQNQFENFKPNRANHEHGNMDAENNFNREQFYNLVKNFDKLQGVKIEFIGSFIWLSNEVETDNKKESATFQQKDVIKSIILEGMNGVRWHRTKSMWYYSPKGYRQFNKGTKSHEDVKNTYGSTEFNSSNRPQQTALNF